MERDSSIQTGRGSLDWEFMADLGKVLIVAGALAIAAGVAFVLLGRAHVPLGRLPGDLVYRGKNTTFYFPLADLDPGRAWCFRWCCT